MTDAPPPELWFRFRRLPLLERLHVRARAFSAPMGALAAQVPPGTLLDLGCGHGLLTAWVALSRPDVRVLGIDPDPRKIAGAKLALADLPNARVEGGTLASIAARGEGPFDAVALADVLYLLPRPEWPAFLSQLRALVKPGGVLLLKEVEGDGSWRHRKGLLQEWVMVRLLRRTHTSGGLSLETREGLTRLLEEAGFRVETVLDLRRGYTSAHLLFRAVSVGG